MLSDVLRKVFGGSVLRLVRQVLETETTAEDLTEILLLIERAKHDEKLL